MVLALWRHKVASFIVLVLMAAGAAFVVLVQPSQYESSATLLLVPPPRPPSAEQIAADPTLRNINTDNPFTRSYDPGIVINVVAGLVNSDSSKKALMRAGAVGHFAVAQTARYGFSSPVAEVAVRAKSPEQAQKTAEIVIGAFRTQLEKLQSDEGVDNRYFIATRLVSAAEPGTLRSSSKLRGLVGVGGLGVLALFTVVSTGDALARARGAEEQGKDRAADHRGDQESRLAGAPPESGRHDRERPVNPPPPPSLPPPAAPDAPSPVFTSGGRSERGAVTEPVRSRPGAHPYLLKSAKDGAGEPLGYRSEEDGEAGESPEGTGMIEEPPRRA